MFCPLFCLYCFLFTHLSNSLDEEIPLVLFVLLSFFLHFSASLNALPPYTATIKCFSEIFYEKFSMNFLKFLRLLIRILHRSWIP